MFPKSRWSSPCFAGHPGFRQVVLVHFALAPVAGERDLQAGCPRNMPGRCPAAGERPGTATNLELPSAIGTCV